MAAKYLKKAPRKEKEKSGVKDELDLRDEILNLKREIAALRKERDKLIIKLRKSEDESKRKDTQIEQLMDPSQNSEIRRLLSMKGAALLLNLKDQNNTLMQMLMEKNQQIKKLGSEIKTAKLYTRTSKTEPYRLEISRLRHLLLQSQEAMKEAAQAPPIMSACISGHSSSSSEDIPSQELEEMRFMVHSLETHMQYSKELLSKKNQEILELSRELGKILRGRCCKGSLTVTGIAGEKQELKYDEAKRCTSAPLLESFHLVRTPKTFEGSSRLTRDQPINFFPKNCDQVTVGSVIEAEKKLLEPEARALTQSFKRGEPIGGKESLPGTVTRKPKLGNCTRKKPGVGKWKCAVKKVRNSQKTREKEGNSERQIHTNPNADDNDVWYHLKSEGTKKKQMSFSDTPTKPLNRKLSLPNNLTNKVTLAEIPSTSSDVPIPTKRTEIEEPSEIITKLERTPRDDKVDQNPNLGSIYRPSIDSSVDTENGSRFEGKLFEVEVEINGFASVSSRSESLTDKEVDGRDNLKKVGGENCFGTFGNVTDEDEDDDDVITI